MTVESEQEQTLTFDDYRQLSAVYDLLGRLWLEELDLDLLTALASEELKPAIEHLGGSVPDSIDEDTVEELAVDYCQLLIGPQGHVSPLQSVWQNRTLQSESAVSMRKFFEYLPGFDVEEQMDDHIGIQLQYMGELFERAANAEDRDLVEQFAEDFFEKHLKWASPFFAAVAEKAETEFYAGLANLTANFLNLEPSEQ